MCFKNLKFTLTVLATAAAALLALAIPASATFSGKNGRIAFVNASGTGSDIFTMNPDGTEVKQLTFFGSNGGFVDRADWSANGRQLVFAAELGPSFISQLW